MNPSDWPAPLAYGCEFDGSGYAVAARRYIRALRRAGVAVTWQPLENTLDGRRCAHNPFMAPPELLALPRATGDEATVLAHCMPQSWGELRAVLGSTRLIGQTVWEADVVPARWQRELAPADEIWVPTEWNASTLRAAGMSAHVHVVPHVVDNGDFTSPPLALDPSRFVFASVCTWDWRKRPDLLLHAYLRAFTAADDVSLVLKTGSDVLSWPNTSGADLMTWRQVMQIVRQYPDAAHVVLDTESWTDQQMAGLWQRADCYVSLTSVEGWGLGAFDAAVAGVPLIITGYGGQLEWLGNDHAGLVPFTIVPADHPDQSMFEPGMTWALADVDAAVDLMRAAVAGDAGFVTAAPALSLRLSQHYSESTVGTLMRGLLS